MTEPPEESDSERAYRLQRDAEENRNSALPLGEEIRLVSFTCIEANTPSTINNLIDGLDELGWVRDDHYGPPFTNLVKWVRATRADPYGGAWANLGYSTDTEAPRPIGGG